MLTYSDSGDNNFVIDLKTQVQVFKGRKFVSKTTNIDIQSFFVAFGPDEKQHIIQEEGKIVFLNENFEKTGDAITIFQSSYQQCGYFFVNEKAVCVYYPSTKQQTGKISVYSTVDRSFIVGFANQ